MGGNFIKTVQELDANEIPANVKKQVLDKYIKSPEWKI